MKSKIILAAMAALAISASAATVESTIGSKNDEGGVEVKISENVSNVLAIKDLTSIASLTVSTSHQHVLAVRSFLPTTIPGLKATHEVGIERFANGGNAGTVTDIDGVVTTTEGGLGSIGDGSLNVKTNGFIAAGATYTTADYQLTGLVSLGTSKVELKTEARISITDNIYSVATLGYTQTYEGSDKNSGNAQIGVGYKF